jgi:predicted RNase H-like HicB family nuclease
MAMSKNTLQKGSVRYIVFRENERWYAVGMEFNVVEVGDSPQEATLLLFEALAGYVEAARKIKARPTILNQKSDPEYEEMWDGLQKQSAKTAEKIFSFGRLNIQEMLSPGALMPA